jgi:hypothetical protein
MFHDLYKEYFHVKIQLLVTDPDLVWLPGSRFGKKLYQDPAMKPIPIHNTGDIK